MVKHAQTIRRQITDELLSVFDYFVGLALKWLNVLFVLKIFRFSPRLFGHVVKRLDYFKG